MKKFLLTVPIISIFVCVLIYPIDLAQGETLTEKWVLTSDEGIHLPGFNIDNNGNLYEAGFTDNSGNKDMLVIEYDPLGNQVSTLTYDEHEYDSPAGVTTDQDGNIYVLQTAKGLIYDEDDYLVVKFDRYGNLLDRWRLNIEYWDKPEDIIADGNGHIYVIGSSNSTYGIVTIKYDVHGNVLWSATYKGGVQGNYANGISLDEEGNVYVAGMVNDYLYYQIDWDFMTLKYDSSGNLLWARRYDNNSNMDYGEDVAADGSGNVYMTGPSKQHDKLLTIKYDSNGNLIWAKEYTYGYGTYVAGIETDEEDNYFISLSARSSYSNTGTTNIYTTKFDPSGTAIWTETFDMGLVEYVSRIDLDECSNIYLKGSYNNVARTINKGLIIKYGQNDDPCIQTSVAADAFLGQAYNQTLIVDGGLAPYSWQLISGSMPGGLTLNGSSGEITGTPATDGTFNFTVQVEDANLMTVAKDIELRVNLHDPLVITTSPLSSGVIGVPHNQVLAATGGAGSYNWSVISGALPDGLSLDSVTGEISGNPTVKGIFEFTLEVSDAGLNTTTKPFKFTVERDDDHDGFIEEEDCNDLDDTIYPGAPEVKADGIDQNCNMIDVSKANYTASDDSLKVSAISSYAYESLSLDGHGPMTYDYGKGEWQIAVEPVGGDPMSVTVCGQFGCDTVDTKAE